MTNLKEILTAARERRLRAGGAVSAGVIEQLRKYRNQLSIWFVSASVALVVATILIVYYLMKHPSEISHVKAVASFVGVGTGGFLELLRRIWKAWSQTNLLLILLEDATEAQVTAIIDKLIDRV